MIITISLEEYVDIYEFRKVLGFISEDIKDINYDCETNKLILECKNQIDVELLKQEIIKLAEKYKKNTVNVKSIYKMDYHYTYKENIYDYDTIFHVFEDGLIALKGKAIFLFEFFDRLFEKIAMNLGAEKKRYPVLLPVEAYKKTGYLHNSPQYSMFCCPACENIHILEKMEENILSDRVFESIQKPYHALSPSACFHSYLEYQNKMLKKASIFTFRQSVFRNEGRMNYGEIGRLRDYHVRELVFVGNESFVNQKRNETIERSIEVMKRLQLSGEVLTASDPFVLPKMQKYKKIQLIENSKYEMRLNVSESKQISTASFNLHGRAFTYPFSISVQGVEEAVTGCVGFGLERFVIAFLCQFGLVVTNWPQSIREEWDKENGSIRL